MNLPPRLLAVPFSRRSNADRRFPPPHGFPITFSSLPQVPDALRARAASGQGAPPVGRPPHGALRPPCRPRRPGHPLPPRPKADGEGAPSTFVSPKGGCALALGILTVICGVNHPDSELCYLVFFLRSRPFFSGNASASIFLIIN